MKPVFQQRAPCLHKPSTIDYTKSIMFKPRLASGFEMNYGSLVHDKTTKKLCPSIKENKTELNRPPHQDVGQKLQCAYKKNVTENKTKTVIIIFIFCKIHSYFPKKRFKS